jgi:hypothetical protein
MALTPETPALAAWLGFPSPGYWGDNRPSSFQAVVPSDTTALPANTKGLWVGTGGTVVVMGIHDSAAVSLVAVPNGTFIPGQFSRVMAATGASNIVVMV